MSRKADEIDTKTPGMIVIGEYLFVPESRELRGNDGATIVLRDRSADVLSHLAANANQTVSKDALAQAIWSDASAADDSLMQCIDDIRRALGDTDHRLVESLPDDGYRLNAQPVPDTGRDRGAQEAPPAPPGVHAQGKPKRGLMALFFVLLLLGLVLYLIFWPDVRADPDAGGLPRAVVRTV